MVVNSDPAAAEAAEQTNGNQDAASDNQPRGAIRVMAGKDPRKSIVDRIRRAESKEKQGDTCNE